MVNFEGWQDLKLLNKYNKEFCEINLIEKFKMEALNNE